MSNTIDDILKNKVTTAKGEIDTKLLEDAAYKMVEQDYYTLSKLLGNVFAFPLQFVVKRYVTIMQRLRSGKAILPLFVPEYQHNNTKNNYCIVLEKDVMLESTWRPGVLYMNAEGVLIVRDKEEFFDGRFSKITE